MEADRAQHSSVFLHLENILKPKIHTIEAALTNTEYFFVTTQTCHVIHHWSWVPYRENSQHIKHIVYLRCQHPYQSKMSWFPNFLLWKACGKFFKLAYTLLSFGLTFVSDIPVSLTFNQHILTNSYLSQSGPTFSPQWDFPSNSKDWITKNNIHFQSFNKSLDIRTYFIQQVLLYGGKSFFWYPTAVRVNNSNKACLDQTQQTMVCW